MSKPTTPVPKPPSPTNIASFPTEGWLSTTHPTKCVVAGCINDIIGYKDYYIEDECILCTHAFLISAVATTIDGGAYPPGSTKFDDKTGHNCKMSKRLYTSFSLMVLRLDRDSWATTCTKCAFRNLIIQDIDALMYYYDTNKYINSMLVSSPGNLTDMARILARLTLLLVGADTCTPHIINSVWGADIDRRLALGEQRGDLSLVCQKILTLSKVIINKHGLHLDDKPKHANPLTGSTWLQMSPANSPTTAPLHPCKQNLCMQTGLIRDCHCLPANQ